MAWSSSSSSSSSKTPPQKHEVFISFRSEDTQKTFTSHLNAALERLDIKTYIHNNDVERGEEIPTTLVRAIEEANLSVIVFSQNYANSKWCLDELVKIVECGRRKTQIVMPVFYDIDPSVVRNQRGSYAEAFEKHERSVLVKKKVQEWRNALAAAANFSGWDCNLNRTESEIVEEIGKEVLERLNRANVSELDQQIRKYEQLAQLQHQYFLSIPTLENCQNHRATVQRITELKMERSMRLLRLTPDMLSHVENSRANEYGIWSERG